MTSMSSTASSLIRPGRYSIDAYKVVAGKEQFMGSIDMQLDPARAQLDGPVMSGGQARASICTWLLDKEHI